MQTKSTPRFCRARPGTAVLKQSAVEMWGKGEHTADENGGSPDTVGICLEGRPKLKIELPSDLTVPLLGTRMRSRTAARPSLL